jgi:hypothetical protein
MRKVQILKINKLTLVHVSCVDWALVNSCPEPDTFFFLNDLVFGKYHVCSFAFAMRSVKHAYYFNPISGLYFDRYEIFLKGHRFKMSAPLPLEFKKEKLKKHVNFSTFPFVSRVMDIDCLMGDFVNAPSPKGEGF